MLWNVSVGVHVTVNLPGIEAETHEEAEEIARKIALNDIVFVRTDMKDKIDANECGTSIYRCDPIAEGKNDG